MRTRIRRVVMDAWYSDDGPPVRARAVGLRRIGVVRGSRRFRFRSRAEYVDYKRQLGIRH